MNISKFVIVFLYFFVILFFTLPLNKRIGKKKVHEEVDLVDGVDIKKDSQVNLVRALSVQFYDRLKCF